MASWEDRPPWIAMRARAIADWLDSTCGDSSGRHRAAIRDPMRVASASLGYSEPIFGLSAGEDVRAVIHTLPGWDRLWADVDRLQPTLLVIDPINLATVWEGYGPTAVGLFIGALLARLPADCAVLLVGHTLKDASTGVPHAVDVLGSVAWSARCRATLIMRPTPEGAALWVVKANYAAKGRIDLEHAGGAPGGGFQVMSAPAVDPHVLADADKVLAILPVADPGAVEPERGGPRISDRCSSQPRWNPGS